MDYRRPSDASADTTHGSVERKYLSEADIYKELWHGRDFEIASLWQRSVFLGTFLVLAYTSYGLLWASLIGEDIEIATFLISNTSNAILVSIGSISLCSFGLVISVLWIQMAKGSKRWYERYERSIDLMINSSSLEKRVFSFPNQLRGDDGVPMHGSLVDTDCDDSLFSQKAGRYSVSKINIAIGQVALVIWRMLLILHIVLLLIQIFSQQFKASWFEHRLELNIFAFLLGAVVFRVGILPIIQICTKGTRSGN